MSDKATDMPKLDARPLSEERFRGAAERLKRIQAEIAPYVKTRRFANTSTADKWSSGSAVVHAAKIS